jgi:rSAM/selenodomain-associated transferase 2
MIATSTRRGAAVSVSVIIPTLNEADGIADAVRNLRELGADQILVADGGSTDCTVERATTADVVLRAPRGRAAQMNAAAESATGDVLIFLHADCRPEPGALAEARSLLSRRRVVAGCFRMRVAAEGALYRWVDAVASARVWLGGVVYGDQALFLRRELFARLGGFPPLRFLEDVIFSRRLSALGRVVVARRRILVSPRRWQRTGLVRQTVRNWTLVGLAAAGVHPDHLARFYPAIR